MKGKVKNYDIGNMVRDTRLKQNISATVMATSLQISKACLSQIENNKRIPRFELLQKIGAYLKIDLAIFFQMSSQNNIERE